MDRRIAWVVLALVSPLVSAAREVPTKGGLPLWNEASPGVNGRAGWPDAVALAKAVRPSVVSIVATGQREGDEAPTAREFFERFYGGREAPTKGLASGFVLRSDGYILTNEHVVESATGLVVTLSGEDDRGYPATVVGRDDPSDLALIKIEPDHPLPALTLADSDGVEEGQWVAAIGNPFGLSHSLTVGVVSYVGRRDINPSGRPGYYDFIQTDASINPGNSGGPLFDREGRVVGISAAVNATGQGIGFAIPVNMAKDVLPALYDAGSIARSYLGVAIQDLSPELAESFGVDGGVVVTEVTASSPAARAGLRAGDVVTGFDGLPIRRAYRLRWLASSAGVGHAATVHYVRDRVAGEARVELTALPGSGARFERTEAPRPRRDLMPLGFALAGAVLASPHGKGFRVSVVDPTSPAYVAGLREGDVVIRPDAANVRRPRDVTEGLADRPVARLLVQRGLKPMFLAFRVRAR